ncbi:hypothetical protein BDN70DRAFT_876103 [Pholiota conissans]|uniref:Uncharacterized protein n=1 Tax=Pholiota conissans TaxID=109636 RepID=A0A9P5Z908_9AGAR|nr:hypothetical protein BDN70DRAFT_876103 [Pholiota conissans]
MLTSRIAGASFHVMHVQDFWALLPPQDIVAQYMTSLVQVGSQKIAKREAFPDIPNEVYNYRFLPLRDMQNIGITRQTEFLPTRNGFTTHMYPFKTMPDLCSHIHPKFAILELGRKLSEMPAEVAKRHLEDCPLLDDIFVLFRAWTSRLSSKAWDDASYAPASVDDDEEDDSDMDDDHKDANGKAIATAQGETRKRFAPADLTTPPANRPRGEEVVPSTTLDKPNYELNKEELAELNKKAEPQRFHYWLAKMFISEPDGEISQTDFWVKYKDTYADEHLVSLASDILRKVTDIYPRAKVMALREDSTTRFIVRGIAQRKL